MTVNRWQRLIAATTGVALAWSPRVLGFDDQPAPAWNALVCGAVLIAAAADVRWIGLHWLAANREHWITAGVGAWLVVVACSLPAKPAAWTSALLAGLTLLALGAWREQQLRSPESSGRAGVMDLTPLLHKRIP